MIFNSMVEHKIGGGPVNSENQVHTVSEYGKCRQHCRQACAVISKKHPQVKALRDADESMLNSVKDKLDPLVFSRARHIIAENSRVLAAGQALSRNDVAKFGRLMSQSHQSASHLYHISCDQTDFLVEQICHCDGSYGARISGGGFGGSVVALVRPEAAEQISKKVHAAYEDRFGLDSDIYMVKPSQGVFLQEN
jgi:galactokinase